MPKGAKGKKHLPPYFDPKYLLAVIRLQYETTSEDVKFGDLKNKNIKKLIIPAVSPLSPKYKTLYRNRLRLNGKLGHIAKILAINDLFIGDILRVAKKYSLLNSKFRISSIDFIDKQHSPALIAWDAKLRMVSLMRWSKNQQAELFGRNYLPDRFEQDVILLMEKHGLEFYWYESIANLLINGTWYLPRNSSVIELRIYNEAGIVDPKIFLQISSIATREEITSRFAEIEQLQNDMFKYKTRFKSLKSIENVFLSNDDLWEVAEKKYKLKKDRLRYIKSQQKAIARIKSKQINQRRLTIKSLPKNIEQNLVLTSAPFGKILYY